MNDDNQKKLAIFVRNKNKKDEPKKQPVTKRSKKR